MDTTDFSKLGEFSTALTHVLSQLDAKMKNSSTENATFIAITNSLEKHSAAIQSLEQTRDEQKGSMDEALSAHAQMGKSVMEVTSTQCTDIQKGLVELRNDTKRDLAQLQGTLQITFQESLEALLGRLGPPVTAEFPAITAEMAPEEVLRILHGRLAALESKNQSQEAINEGLRSALTGDRNTQDRFDEMTSRMVKMERGMEAQNKRIVKSEKQIEALKTSQSKLQKAIQIMEQKVNVVASGGGFSLGGGCSTGLMDEATSTVDISPEEVSLPNDEEGDEEVTPRLRFAPMKDGPRMSTLKDKLKSQRHSQRLPPIDGEDDDNGEIMPSQSEDSLDSRGLVDDYMLGKMDDIDSKVNEDLTKKVIALQENEERLQHAVKALQDAVKDLEKAAEEAKDHPVTVEYDHASQMQKVFKGITFDMRDGWIRAYEELDRKVAKMDHVTAKEGQKPDDHHLRLTSFKHFLEKTLADIDTCVTTIKEAEASSNPDVKETVLRILVPLLESLIPESVCVVEIETKNKQVYDKLPPGVAVPVSELPSKLPEHLTTAIKKANAFLDEGISKVDLKQRMDTMQTDIDSKESAANFQKLEDDMKIAMTLKADNKALETINVKKASCVELQKFREHVADEIDGMREILVKNAASASKMLQTVSTARGSDNGELSQRFDLLFQQLQDMQRGVASFVPRSEIEIALQALLEEVKNVQRNAVDRDVLGEKLKKKADRGDVERLLALLSGSVGDPGNGFAAAMHKCLVCDKPTNPFGVSEADGSPIRARPNQSATQRLNSPTQNTGGYNRPSTSSAALGRTSGKGNAEVNILRNSMESLPPVHTPSTNTSSKTDRESAALAKNRQVQKRIRATAGGGMG